MHIERYGDVTAIQLTRQTFNNMKMHIYMYEIDGILIDSGPPRLQHIVTRYVDEVGIDVVLYTHHHEDHTGAGAALQRRGIPQHIHPLGIPICERRTHLPLYRYWFWGNRAAFHPTPLSQTFQSTHYTFEVIHTPGHAVDHVCLYVPELRLMFTGDLFVKAEPKSIFSFESIPTMIRSLRHLLTYSFDVIYCQHAGRLEDGKAHIQRKLDYLVAMTTLIQDAARAGWSERKIAQHYFPKRHPMRYISGGAHSPLHLIRSILQTSDEK